MAAARSERAQRAAAISLAATIVVVIAKLAAGFASGAVSVLGEGLQSTVDVLIAFAVLHTLRLAARPPDPEHPYGHGKAELLVSALQMVLILVAAGMILHQAGQRLFAPREIEVDWGLAAMAYAVVSNTLVGWHVSRVAESTNSHALRSEALHLRGDSLASLGVLLGLVGVKLTGWTPIDPLIAIAFMLIVVFGALRGIAALVHPLMDGALPSPEVERVAKVLESHPEVRGYHDLRTRQVGTLRYVELHVMLDDDLDFVRAHDIAEQIEEEIRKAVGGAVVALHYEPFEAEMEHRRREHRGS
jgi:cation diffusion facilitator family transporter